MNRTYRRDYSIYTHTFFFLSLLFSSLLLSFFLTHLYSLTLSYTLHLSLTISLDHSICLSHSPCLTDSPSLHFFYSHTHSLSLSLSLRDADGTFQMTGVAELDNVCEALGLELDEEDMEVRYYTYTNTHIH